MARLVEDLNRLSTWSRVEPRSPQSEWRRGLWDELTAILPRHRVYSAGSQTRGTAIGGFSDWDYFLVFPTSASAPPSTVMASIQRAVKLGGKAPFVSSVDWPVLSFEDKFDASRIEIVPAYPHDGGGLLIPDPDESDQWIPSEPEKHARFFNRVRSDDPNMLLLRLLKIWKYLNDLPISSLNLELMAAEVLLSRSLQIDPWNQLVLVLKELKSRGLEPLQDPSTPTKRLVSAGTGSEHGDNLLSRIENAIVDADRIVDLAKSGASMSELEAAKDLLMPPNWRSSPLVPRYRGRHASHFRDGVAPLLSQKTKQRQKSRLNRTEKY